MITSRPTFINTDALPTELLTTMWKDGLEPSTFSLAIRKGTVADLVLSLHILYHILFSLSTSFWNFLVLQHSNMIMCKIFIKNIIQGTLYSVESDGLEPPKIFFVEKFIYQLRLLCVPYF